jgi:Sigma-70 region 3
MLKCELPRRYAIPIGRGGAAVTVPIQWDVNTPLRCLQQQPNYAIADQARTIRLPVHMIEIVNQLVRTSRQLVQTLGREPTSAEIARQMDIPEAKVRKVRKIMRG